MTDVEKLVEALRKERLAHKETQRRLTQAPMAQRLHKERMAHAQTRSVLLRALADLARLTPTDPAEPRPQPEKD